MRTRPVAVTTVHDRRKPGTPWPLRAAGWVLWRLVLKPLGLAAGAALYLGGMGVVFGARGGWRAVTGRYRAWFVPAWVGAAAVVVPVWPGWVAWFTAAVALYLVRTYRLNRPAPARPVMSPAAMLQPPVRKPRKRVSEREALALTVVASAVGFVTLASASYPGMVPWWVPAVPVVVWAPWWWASRRVKTVKPTAVVQVWEERVASKGTAAGYLAGTRIVHAEGVTDTPDGPEGDAVLEVPDGVTASMVAAQDEKAEALMRMHPGQITIAKVPDLPANMARIRFASRGDAGRTRWFDGPTLDPATGLFVGGYAGQVACRPALWRPGSAVNWAFVSGPGGGKGGTERVVCLEAALSDRVVLLFMDGKRGKGNPAVRDGADFYAATPDEWKATMHAFMRLLEIRMDRPDIGSRFTPRPGDPMVLLIADEWKWIRDVYPGFADLALKATGLGRSLGIGFGASLQKGDAVGWGSPELRSNVYSNGTLWAGTAGDVAAAGVAAQGYGVDLGALPPEPGWGYWLSQSNAAMTDAGKYRTIYSPDAADVADGMEAPFGACEDYMRDAVRSSMATQEERDVLAALTAGDPGLVADADDAEADAQRARDARVAERILQVLSDLGPDRGMKRAEIAMAVGASPGYTSNELNSLKADGLVRQDGTLWKVAA